MHEPMGVATVEKYVNLLSIKLKSLNDEWRFLLSSYIILFDSIYVTL